MGVQAIRCGTFLYRGWNRTREIQKPLVFGGVLFHISFAVERNMAAGGIEKKVVGPLRPKVTRARSAEYSRRRERSERRRWRIQRGERVAAVKISSARRQAAQKFRAPQQCSFLNINRAAGPYGVRLSSCAGKCGRGAGRKKRDQDRTRFAIGVGVVRAGDAIARGQNRNILLFHFFHSRKRFRRKALYLLKNGDF